jgi:hypothetical protein
MAAERIDRIRTLTGECLNRCRESGSALAALAVFLKELRQKHYRDDGIRLVDCRVRRVLWALMDNRESWPRDASAMAGSARDRELARVNKA